MKRQGFVALGVVAFGGVALWFSGLLVRFGGSAPALWSARSAIDDLDQVVALDALGLAARTVGTARCSPARVDGLSRGVRGAVSCQSSRFRIAWSVCTVPEAGNPWAKSPRTDTCDPHDSEEGMVSWNQEPVATVRIAGYDGFIVDWRPEGRAKRGAGCSFRGYREAEDREWTVLHIEASPACDPELLAMMLSTRVP